MMLGGPRIGVAAFELRGKIRPKLESGAGAAICAGPDGKLWFTHQSTAPSAIGNLMPDGTNFGLIKTQTTNSGPIRAVAGVSAFGRLIVLGAGGCRRAYDLHGACDVRETVVVDIDPYLLVVAEAILRGQTVALTESSLNVCDADHVSARRALHAPRGRLGAERFHFLFANGLDPPFADRTSDTVVTP